ncbi:SDR family NAD(P)-dependent oxidoreductase, partial [Yinghuangia sp. YIM S09857]|uniref:SDR family NAD(P)-dependent oxidoreductase n=1 Tax=Yinghuangia sp. YIM S09857 TaxID=3436929 RepID=UPI003F531013
MFDLKGRTALVTGSGQGVGAGIAELPVAQGAQVAVNDIDLLRADETVRRLGEAGHAADSLPFDVTDYDAVREAVHRFERRVGPVDILVNNVGNAIALGLIDPAASGREAKHTRERPPGCRWDAWEFRATPLPCARTWPPKRRRRPGRHCASMEGPTPPDARHAAAPVVDAARGR